MHRSISFLYLAKAICPAKDDAESFAVQSLVVGEKVLSPVEVVPTHEVSLDS
jgi:hypothetical protein